MSTERMKTLGSESDNMFSGIAHVARNNAKNKPNDVAVKFISGVSKGEQLTFSELDDRALKVASYLVANTAKGDRVLLPTNNESAFYCGFLGCLYTGRVGIPIQVPKPKPKLQNMGLDRFTSVISNAGVKLILIDESYMAALDEMSDLVDEYFCGATFTSVQSILSTSVGNNQISLPESNELAFLQYTSGSTSAPKGVMLTNQCIVENQQSMVECYQLSSNSNMITWLPLYHDMGLCTGFFMPIYLGVTSVVFTPLSVMAKPKIWLQEISKHNNAVSGGPNFVFSHCVNRLSADDLEDLDLSQWTVAFCGAEPIIPNDISDFIDKFSSAGFNERSFFPSYGLAEATLFVSAKRAKELPVTTVFDYDLIGQNRVKLAEQNVTRKSAQLMSCGRPGFGADVKIINPETLSPLPEGHVGEIAVYSKSVGKGYWNNKAESEKTFNQTIEGIPEREYFLTGDYGFINDNQLYVSGRRKEVIIVNGVNHYPQDIELTARQQDPLLINNRSAVFTVDKKSPTLILVHEVKEKISIDTISELKKRIIQAVRTEHQLIIDEVYVVSLGVVPRTSSGKTQRTKCSKLYELGHFEYNFTTKIKATS